MSDKTQTPNAQPNTDTPKQGFGQALAKARKLKVWSVDDVAGELNILKRHVIALEEEDYEALPSFAFARGFLMNYLKLLKLDDPEIVKQFEQGYPKHLRQDSIENIKAPLQPMSTLQRGRSSVKINYGLILGVIGVIVLAVAILKMVNGAKSTQETTVPTETHVSEGLSPTEQAQGAAIGTGSALNNTGSALGTASTGTEAVLDLWIKGDVNVEVTDSTGTKLLSGQQSRGGKQLKGVAPLTVVIDDASKVDLNFNQNPIKLSTLAQDGKINITLPQ